MIEAFTVALAACLAVFPFAVVYLWEYFSGPHAIKCPKCSAEIESADWERGQSCPGCGDAQVPDLDCHSSVTEKVCYHCQAAASPERAVGLWDGNTYCRDCVQQESRALWEHAEKSDCFREQIEHAQWDLMRPALKPMFVALCCLSLGGGLIALIGGNVRAAVVIPLIIFGLLAPFLFVCAIASAFVFARRRNVVTIRRGNLVLQTGPDTTEVALAGCVWFESQNLQITVTDYLHRRRGFQRRGQRIVVPGPAIVIRTPSSWYLAYTHQLAVGFAPENYEIWRSFLKLSGIPQLPSDTPTYPFSWSELIKPPRE